MGPRDVPSSKAFQYWVNLSVRSAFKRSAFKRVFAYLSLESKRVLGLKLSVGCTYQRESRIFQMFILKVCVSFLSILNSV